jgi:hypothetical protein
MFHYFKIPYFTCHVFTKFTYNEYIGPYFLSHVVLRFSPSDLPGGLRRSNQTGCKVWIEQPKPAARLGSSNMKVQRTFIYLNSYMVFKDPECPTYIVSITHHNSFDGNYFGVICIVYSSNTIYISL